ncbi:hypothetical protein GOBAR_DD32822 [Gossypium barbadense]|nr:hypothetical protein GOBAR_DD32822 [Gossypium barbadense]
MLLQGTEHKHSSGVPLKLGWGARCAFELSSINGISLFGELLCLSLCFVRLNLSPDYWISTIVLRFQNTFRKISSNCCNRTWLHGVLPLDFDYHFRTAP